jgi:glutathione S-transferase
MTAAIPSLVLCDFPADTGHARWSSFSPFVLEVERGLRLAKLPFRQQKISMMTLRKLNPLGQLPALKIGDEVVVDSTRILLRIEKLAPGSLTRGLGARESAEAWLWEEFADTALYPYVLETRWADERGWSVPRKAFFGGMPPVVRDVVANLIRRKTLNALVGRDFTRAGLPACEERMFRVLDQLEARAPETGFWMGEQPSVADVGLFAHLHSLRLPQTPFRAADIAQRARLSRWLDRVDAATSGDAASVTQAQSAHA